MVDDIDIIVVGSGVVGLAAAAALNVSPGAQWRIVVIDSGEAPAESAASISSLRVSALSPTSIDVLDKAGAWAGIAALAQPFTDMRVWDAETSPFAGAAVHFDATDIGVAALGSIVENDRVRAALIGALTSAGVAIRFGQRLVGLRRNRSSVSVELADGQALTARLVIAADGANSQVRRWLRIPSATKHYEQHALVCHVESQHPHDQTAWQQFNTDGPLALLPLADGRSSVVYSTTQQRAAELAGAADDELGAALTAASNAALGTLTVASRRASFPLAAAQADRYVADRVALIGDAAHRVHPLAGQGANLGVADAELLAASLAAAGRNADPGDAALLAGFARARRREAKQMIIALDVLQRLFTNESTTLQRLRTTGMRWFNANSTMKRLVARSAMGLG
ncbi:MAG: FAD-dependent monooxygenase [Pseudomonadota bacterium]